MRSLLALCCLWLVACGSPGGEQTGEVQPLRLLSYNIHHGEGVDGLLDLERIATLIDESSADLVALQEVDCRAERSTGVDQAAELGRLTQREPAFAKFMEFQGGEYGLAILSRHPIRRSWTIELPSGKREPRAALAVETVVPGHGPLTFVCLHFDWLADDEERFAQATALLSALEEIEMPVILAGDFNDRPGSRTLELIEDQFQNVPKVPGSHLTFSSREPQREIDFIMQRPPGSFVGQARTLVEPDASDHLPVLAELR